MWLPTGMQRTLLLGLPLSLSLLLCSSPAKAERDVHKSVLSPVRDGFTMGATFGRGSIEVDCATCSSAKLTEALSVSAHAGYMVTPQLAVLGEHWSVRYNARGGALFDDSQRHLVAQHISTIAAQLFVTNRLWVKAGLGVGWHITDGDYDKIQPSSEPMPVAAKGSSVSPAESESDSSGSASFVAVGYELAHNKVFAADIQLRVGATRLADDRYKVYNTGLNVGFNWY
jgi:hypothetical protein